MTATLWAIDAIETAMRSRGSHWFDRDTMAFFGTRIVGRVYQGQGGVYFVTSEQPPHGPRAAHREVSGPRLEDDPMPMFCEWCGPTAATCCVCGRGQGAEPNLPERIAQIVREWPQWSRAERRRMDQIVEEVLDHCRNGTGNEFIRDWCRKFLPREKLAIAVLDSLSVPFPAPRQ